MRKACVIGWPIAHSRSPVIHRFWLKQHGIAGSYDKIAVEPDRVDAFITDLKRGGFSGCNVTIPHKERVFQLAEVLHDEARAIGAANTLWFDTQGRLNATNTDAYGYMSHLQATAPGWEKNSGPALILGAGGAARAVVHGLLGAGVGRIVVANRSLDRAEAVAQGFGSRVQVTSWGAWSDAARTAAVVVNTTALGMDGAGVLDFDVGVLKDDCVVSDVVYVPLETPLLKAAQARGLRVVDGLGMLLHQAVPGFELWFGVRPRVTPELHAAVVDDLNAEAHRC